MTTLIAVHAVTISDPAAEMVHTGQYDASGNALVRKATLTIQPGEFFEYDEPDLAWLIDQEAARYPTDTELQLRTIEREDR